MRNLALNVSTEEIAKIVKEEKAQGKKFNQTKNLALLTDSEKYELTQTKKFSYFYSKNQEQIEEFENKVFEKIDEWHIEYKDDFEGEYGNYFWVWIKEAGYTFEKFWEMMVPVIEEYEYPFITFRMLFVCFDLKYAGIEVEN